MTIINLFCNINTNLPLCYFPGHLFQLFSTFATANYMHFPIHICTSFSFWIENKTRVRENSNMIENTKKRTNLNIALSIEFRWNVD